MSQSEARLVLPVGDRDHAQGPANAPVTLVEYGDYECSYCGQAYPIVKGVQEQLGDSLRFVFRNFPISTSHPHAQHAAEAAETAAAYGKFWEMHDALYEHQSTLNDNDLRELAESVGVDAEAFDRDMTDHRFADRVQEDFMSGVRSGVNGTPTFFINGVRYDGSWDPESLLEALQHAAG
jgi:protein-disulfide isomerase